ncbi:MAG: hypothetical protein MK212_19230, partial [Saprospiraceae bacterium]|nr:hypothetical protein [Saprospiraceae bacterium]
MKPILLLLLTSCFINLNLSYAQNIPYISNRDAINDLEHLIEKIEQVHYNPYFKIDKKSFQILKDSVTGLWNQDSISLTAFMEDAMQLTALLSGGHTMVDWQNELLFPALLEYKFIPLKARLNNNGWVEITQTKDSQLKEGMLIKSINGISAKVLYQRTMSYVGGLEAFKNAYAADLFPLLLFFNPEIKAPYQLELSNAKTIDLKNALSVQELQEFLSADQAEENYSFKILKHKT